MQGRRKIQERTGYATVALLVAVATVAVAIAVPSPPAPANAGLPLIGRIGTQAPPGYRFESTLGMQIAVPAGWQIDDFGCQQDARPSFVRGIDGGDLCLTPTPVAKEFAEITMSGKQPDPDDSPADIDDVLTNVTERRVAIDGVPAIRAEGPINYGRFAGWIRVESRGVILIVRTNSRARLTAILDSAQVVAIDHFGCPTAPPDPRRRPVPTVGPTFVDPAPLAVTVCSYGDGVSTGPLQASTQRTGAEAARVATALNDTTPGVNPDLPGFCVRAKAPHAIPAVLLVYPRYGAVQEVTATFGACTGVHLDNGRQYRQLTQALITLIMDGTFAAYVTLPE